MYLPALTFGLVIKLLVISRFFYGFREDLVEYGSVVGEHGRMVLEYCGSMVVECICAGIVIY